MMTWLLVLVVLGIGEEAAAASLTTANTLSSTRTADLDEMNQDRVIAIGFGYQRGVTSSIRIRTYDIITGDMLSEDQFDLNVVGGEPRESEPPGDRVFAGAISLTAAGLGDFPMRVYDAQSGRYLWQGHLNFVDVGSDDPRRRAHTSPFLPSLPAPARLVLNHSTPGIQSHLLVRAVDPASGKAIWQQSFESAAPAAEVISGADLPNADPDVVRSRDYEIVVRSYELETGTLVWSDRLSTRDVVEEMIDEAASEQAQPIPLFRMREHPEKVWVWERWSKEVLGVRSS